MRLLLSTLLLPTATARECGQKEVDAQDITGCSSILHMKFLHHKGAIWLGDALHHNPHLEFLDLHHTNIGDDDAESLANGLHNNTFLKRLAMHNNQITDVGATHIANALKENDALEFLSLSSNGVGDVGAKALAEGLHHNKALRRLDLYFNLIGDEGAVALAHALGINRGLYVLHLDTNSVGEVGALALAHAIAGGAAAERHKGWGGVWKGEPKAPPMFGELTLMYNHLSNKAADACMDAARDNHNVHTMNLAHNHHVTGKTAERLKNQHEPRMEERLAIASFLVAHELIKDTKRPAWHAWHSADAEWYSAWHSADGPPLASPYAPVVTAMKLHTKEGLMALRDDDAEALAARPEIQGFLVYPEERKKLVDVILKAVAMATAAGGKDEL